ncbi:MAG: RHS repeat protein [Betaproteobacteria bacterium]|nr:RHS repeat protein [Betaproteobacteria bacterium]
MCARNASIDWRNALDPLFGASDPCLARTPALAIVDMKNANYSNTWTDFSLPAPEVGVALKLERTYNSRTLFNGMFGFGWCMNFETSLAITAEGNLKRKSCGAGGEDVFVSAPLTRQGVESVIDEIIRQKKAKETSYRNDEHYRELREELLEYDDKRTALAREMGLLAKPIEGKKYAPPARSWQIVEQGEAQEVAPQYSAEVIFQDGSFRLTWDDGSQEHFDRQGRLLRLIDQAGYVLKLHYFDNGLLKTVSDGKGRSLRFEYYAGNRKVRRVTASNGTLAEYQYRDKDDLSYSIDSKRFATAYTYDDLHNIVKIIFTDGSSVRLEYDTNNDWVRSFVDRDNCREDYCYEVDPKDPKGHFWSTVTKTCGGRVVVHSLYEFIGRLNETGEYELNKVDVSDLPLPAKAGRPARSASSRLPKDCERDRY